MLDGQDLRYSVLQKLAEARRVLFALYEDYSKPAGLKKKLGQTMKMLKARMRADSSRYLKGITMPP